MGELMTIIAVFLVGAFLGFIFSMEYAFSQYKKDTEQ